MKVVICWRSTIAGIKLIVLMRAAFSYAFKQGFQFITFANTFGTFFDSRNYSEWKGSHSINLLEFEPMISRLASTMTWPHLIIVVDVDGACDDGRGKEEADQREKDGGPAATATAAAASSTASVILGEVSTTATATHRFPELWLSSSFVRSFVPLWCLMLYSVSLILVLSSLG